MVAINLGCIHIDFEISIRYYSRHGKKADECVSGGSEDRLKMDINIWKWSSYEWNLNPGPGWGHPSGNFTWRIHRVQVKPGLQRERSQKQCWVRAQ